MNFIYQFLSFYSTMENGKKQILLQNDGKHKANFVGNELRLKTGYIIIL